MTNRLTSVKIDSIFDPPDLPFYHRPLRNTGNSVGVYLPKEMLTELGWKADHVVRIVLEGDRIVLEDYDKPHRYCTVSPGGDTPNPAPVSPDLQESEEVVEKPKPKFNFTARKKDGQ